MVALGTIFVALVISLLLTVYALNELTNAPEPAAEKITAEMPEGVEV